MWANCTDDESNTVSKWLKLTGKSRICLILWYETKYLYMICVLLQVHLDNGIQDQSRLHLYPADTLCTSENHQLHRSQIPESQLKIQRLLPALFTRAGGPGMVSLLGRRNLLWQIGGGSRWFRNDDVQQRHRRYRILNAGIGNWANHLGAAVTLLLLKVRKLAIVVVAHLTAALLLLLATLEPPNRIHFFN